LRIIFLLYDMYP